MRRVSWILLLCACEQRLVVGRFPDASAEAADAGVGMPDADAPGDSGDDACRSDDDCRDGDDPYCALDEGECAECLEDAHCSDGGVCEDGECEECREDADCPDGGVCDDAKCD
jgi:Cys-rich repeat protein